MSKAKAFQHSVFGYHLAYFASPKANAYQEQIKLRLYFLHDDTPAFAG